MSKGRLEAFSDGVIAIVITIMVLELHVPHGVDLAALAALWPVFFCYLLSFVFVGIYWNNHHHLLHAATKISGSVLWANLHLLFWLSLVPFTTRWLGENHFAPLPTALYGVDLLLASVAYFILVRAILATQKHDSTLAVAVGKDVKGKVSVLIYLVAVPLAFVRPWIADLLYVLVAGMWLVPDRRIETRLGMVDE